MPIKYEIFENEKLVMAQGVGEVTGRDVLEHLDQLAADSRYVSPMKKFVDYRTIKGINISQAEAQEIARKKQALSKIFREERCAFVSPRGCDLWAFTGASGSGAELR